MLQNPHTVLDGYASLRRHHLAKEQIRNQQLDLIPIPQSGRVLDIGMGPGLYLRYWLERTQEKNAHFDLFDSSAEALQICEGFASSAGASGRVRTVVGDLFSDIDRLQRGTYDLIFIGNTIEYVPNPVEYLKDFILPLLKRGGILAIRDLDCSFMSCTTMDASLNQRIVQSRIANNAANSRIDPKNYQNPFIGKELEAIVQQAGLTIQSVHPFHIQFAAPIVGDQRAYLEALHKSWYVEDTLGLLSPNDKKTWRTAFDSANPQNVFDNPQTKYAEAEFLVIGRKED